MSIRNVDSGLLIREAGTVLLWRHYPLAIFKPCQLHRTQKHSKYDLHNKVKKNTLTNKTHVRPCCYLINDHLNLCHFKTLHCCSLILQQQISYKYISCKSILTLGLGFAVTLAWNIASDPSASFELRGFCAICGGATGPSERSTVVTICTSVSPT